MGREVKISESCSCGASLKIEHRNAVALAREWRAEHKCLAPDSEVQAVHGTESGHERAIGFQAGLIDPARSSYPDWEGDE
jgi:hypothetical protein